VSKSARETVVAELKAKRAEAARTVAACDAALVAFGIGNSTGATKTKRRGGGMQAAHDAMAVKRGTATAEQTARWEKRQAGKKAKAKAEPVGASLVAAAAE
jgi:hypothetical protein